MSEQNEKPEVLSTEATRAQKQIAHGVVSGIVATLIRSHDHTIELGGGNNPEGVRQLTYDQLIEALQMGFEETLQFLKQIKDEELGPLPYRPENSVDNSAAKLLEKFPRTNRG